MMNLRQRTVNVDRKELLSKLKANLEVHRKEYQEALIEFRARLEEDLAAAHNKVSQVANPEELKNFRVNIQFPANHEQDYLDVIEMLEMSVDDVINLDSESFKAYIKNEWGWAQHFIATKALYGVAGSTMSL